MRASDREPREWAGKLLDLELGGRTGEVELAEAAERLCNRFSSELSPLIGVEGVTAVLRRAMRMAQDDYPFLAGVEVQTESDGRLVGLTSRVKGRDPREVRDALVAIIGNAIWLLVTFIGRDITLRQLRRVWPEAQLGS